MVAGVITDLTDWLDRVSSHHWFLLVILVIAFLDSIIESREPAVSAVDGYKSVEIVEAVYESIRIGEAIRFD